MMATTNAVNVGEATDAIESVLKQGKDALVLDLALRSYANMIACHQALTILAQHSGHEDLLSKKK